MNFIWIIFIILGRTCFKYHFFYTMGLTILSPVQSGELHMVCRYCRHGFSKNRYLQCILISRIHKYIWFHDFFPEKQPMVDQEWWLRFRCPSQIQFSQLWLKLYFWFKENYFPCVCRSMVFPNWLMYFICAYSMHCIVLNTSGTIKDWNYIRDCHP